MAAAAKPAKSAKTKKQAADSLAAVCRFVELMKQAADPTRLKLLLILNEKEQNTTQLTAEMDSSQPSVSHHLARLRMGGTIEMRKEGKCHMYRLTELGQKLIAVAKAAGA